MAVNPENLDARIAKARADGRRRRADEPGPAMDAESAQALGFGLRGGIEFISAVFAGGALGWVIDRWLGTRPVGLLILMLFGFGFALFKVWRVMTGGGMKPPLKKEEGTDKVDGESA